MKNEGPAAGNLSQANDDGSDSDFSQEDVDGVEDFAGSPEVGSPEQAVPASNISDTDSGEDVAEKLVEQVAALTRARRQDRRLEHQRRTYVEQPTTRSSSRWGEWCWRLTFGKCGGGVRSKRLVVPKHIVCGVCHGLLNHAVQLPKCHHTVCIECAINIVQCPNCLTSLKGEAADLADLSIPESTWKKIERDKFNYCEKARKYRLMT